MINTNQHSQTSESPLQLTELPYDVLFRIAKFTLCDQDRISVMRLALAAQAFYAPCLHVAIQSEPQFQWRKLRMHHAKEDTLLATSKLVGRVFGVEEQLVPAPGERGNTHRAYLGLPPRTEHREQIVVQTALPRGFRARPVVVSRHWSLVRVPWSQVRTFSIDEQSRSVVVPPQCHTLLVVGRDVALDAIVLLPSLVTLELHELEAPLDVVRRFLAKMPPRLRQLRISYAFNSLDPGAFVAETFLRVPDTLTTLDVMALGPGPLSARVKAELMALVQRLPALTSFALQTRGLSGLDDAIRALPRNDLDELYLDLCNEDKSDQFSNLLVAGLPKTVGSLCLFADFVPPSLPLATRALTIGIPCWDAATARMVPLASTLRKLHLTSGPDYVPHSADHLVNLLSRLPNSLMTLALTGYSLPGPALVALHQRLPPRLIKLKLKQCNLVRAAHVNDLPLPRSLRDLDLSRNHFDPDLPHVQHGVEALHVTMGMISANASICAWLQSLPPTLRSLDLAGSPISVQDADILIEHVSENVEHLQMRVSKDRIASMAFERLQTRFDVIAM